MEPRRIPTVALPSTAEGAPAAAPTNEQGARVRFETLLQPDAAAAEETFQSLAGSLATTIVRLVVPEIAQAEQGLIAAATGEAIAHAGMPPAQSLPGVIRRGETELSISGTGNPSAEPSVNAPSGPDALGAAMDVAGLAEVELALATPPPPDGAGTASLERTPLERTTPDDASQPHASRDGGRLLKRFARAVAAAQQREGEIRLRLHSPEFGSLKLEVQVRDGALAARVEAETADARNALLDNMPVLRERLSEQGLRIERFDVELMQQQAGDESQAPPDRERPPPALPMRQPPAPDAPPRQAGAADSPFPRRRPGRLNVII
jgi:hypothetical protein